MNEFTYYNKCFALISDALFPVKKSGICPECGTNILRRVAPFPEITGRGSFSLYADISELEYGEWECVEHHTFEVVPEYCRDNNPDYPVGMKIN